MHLRGAGVCCGTAIVREGPVKASVAAGSPSGGWFVVSKAMRGNPYVGHTPREAVGQIDRIAQRSEHTVVDIGGESPAHRHIKFDPRRYNARVRKLIAHNELRREHKRTMRNVR